MSKVTKRKKPLKDRLSMLLLRIILGIFTIIVGFPIIWAIYTSFKTSKEFLNNPWSLPSTINFENYINAFEKAGMGDLFLNSIMITLGALLLLLFLVVPTAYVIARFNTLYSRILKNVFLAGLFIGGSYTIVPLFLQLNSFNMLDNRFVLTVLYAAGGLSFNIYLLTGFLKGIPRDYEEAAMIDGCNEYETLFYVMMPLIKPGIVTVSMFAFMGFWNEYLQAFTFILSDHKKTLPVGIENLMQIAKYATDWGAMFAGLVMVMLPTLVVYCFIQKKLTEGISMGGLKG